MNTQALQILKSLRFAPVADDTPLAWGFVDFYFVSNALLPMIRMPLRWLVFTARSIFLAGILFTWICYEIARRRREAQKLRSWTQCPVCNLPIQN